MHTSSWFLLMCGRDQRDPVKQLPAVKEPSGASLGAPSSVPGLGRSQTLRDSSACESQLLSLAPQERPPPRAAGSPQPERSPHSLRERKPRAAGTARRGPSAQPRPTLCGPTGCVADPTAVGCRFHLLSSHK